jgi:hypothetical protein
VDEADLWFLTEVNFILKFCSILNFKIATLVQNAFCYNICNFSKPSLKMKRQINADIGELFKCKI